MKFLLLLLKRPGTGQVGSLACSLFSLWQYHCNSTGYHKNGKSLNNAVSSLLLSKRNCFVPELPPRVRRSHDVVNVEQLCFFSQISECLCSHRNISDDTLDVFIRLSCRSVFRSGVLDGLPEVLPYFSNLTEMSTFPRAECEYSLRVFIIGWLQNMKHNLSTAGCRISRRN